MYTEKQILSQCDHCRKEYKAVEGCPKERGCSRIPILACRIRSIEYSKAAGGEMDEQCDS